MSVCNKCHDNLSVKIEVILGPNADMKTEKEKDKIELMSKVADGGVEERRVGDYKG